LAHVCFPRARSYTRPYFDLSYFDAETRMYSAGSDDFAYVAFWFVLFTGLRALVMEFFLQPFASWGGLKKKQSVRFAEQGWLVLYYSIFVPAGFVRLRNCA
jgi:very-long-chain ceramide synthase